MATGNDLNPCRVVDVEWRWLLIGGRREGRTIVMANSVMQPCVLQTRKLVRDDHGRTEWTEWQDMPVVEV